MRPKLYLTPLALTLALVLAGCGGGAQTETASDGTTTVNVGVVPVTTVAPLYLGMEKGFFKEEGLTVKAKTISTSPSIIAGVTSGEVDFGFSATASILQAHSRGIPLPVVVGGSYSDKSEPSTGLIAGKGSNISSVKDLDGKKIAINELEGQSELGIRALAKENNVPQKSLNFVALPFPEMTAALNSGRVDAAGMVQPFGASAVRAGHGTVTDDYYQEIDPKTTVTSWFTNGQLVQENPEVVKKFSRALSKSMDYAISHPEEVTKTIPTYTKITQEDAAKLPVSATSPKVVMDSVETQAKLMNEFDILDDEVDLDSYVAAPVRDEVVE